MSRMVEFLNDPAAVDAVVAALESEGAAAGNSIHSWRCEYPDRYGPCNCVQETAYEVLAALTSLLATEEVR